MKTDRLEGYLRAPAARGPIAVALCEDATLVVETVDWLKERGAAHVVTLGPGAAALPDDALVGVSAVTEPIHDPARRAVLLNRLIEAHRGEWMIVCFNGEFLFHPFSDTRSVRDLIEFLWSERRDVAMTYAIDLYAERMEPDGAVDLSDVYFDSEGWYGFERGDGQVDVYGGLGWRFEEFTPAGLARVNRPALFRAGPGVALREDLWLVDEAMNTIACPWHNNPTAALMSLRRARRLTSHPNFARAIPTLKWPNSVKFEWKPDQLIAYGLIEAGQWM